MIVIVVATFIAGLGLFIIGLQFLSNNLKILSGKKLRILVGKLTQSTLQGVFWGGVISIVTPSMRALMFILVGMLRSGIINVLQAIRLLTGANMLGALMLFLLVINIKIAVLLLLGMSAIAFASERAKSIRPIVGSLFGISLLFFGLNMMKTGVAPLVDTIWFEEAIRWTHGTYILVFIIGAILIIVIQSSLAVLAIIVAFQQAGLFDIYDSIMVFYGCNVGSSTLTWMRTTRLKGESKQVAMYQVSYNYIGALIFVPLFYLEYYSDFPLIKHLTESLTSNGGIQIAYINLFFNLVPGILLMIFMNPVIKLLGKLWPETVGQKISKPKYLFDHAAKDPDSATDLILLEQMRLVKLFSRYFEGMRETRSEEYVRPYTEAFVALEKVINENISEVAIKPNLSPKSIESINSVLAIQHLLESTNNELVDLAARLDRIKDHKIGKNFAFIVIESLDAIYLTLLEYLENNDYLELEMLNKMTSNNGKGIESVRKVYLAEETGLDSKQRLQLLAATNHCERIIRSLGVIGDSVNKNRNS